MTKFYLFVTIFSFQIVGSQQKDSTQLISEVHIDAYKKPGDFISSTKSVGIISKDLLQQSVPERLLESVNQIAGARMEERSPGSYRLSLRGSTLRSPFGVRNVKVYFDDFILSDASGNTYFNVISPQLIDRIELFRGPESGDYGSVTGGTIILKTKGQDEIKTNLSIGSYGNLMKVLIIQKLLESISFKSFKTIIRLIPIVNSHE
ncbi:TonB-dependent receptor plug domain-containing protein [Epilithonimonas sp.]|uniref:TonB-dependent receptor plug domain-containing protein n=1 Tax=Epilithonimonas sp. TaxID=2894511 RepID=UPI0028972570|nr:TonB-dependent receptor plug domain-containing protein [Epilithonimonas sp.]